MVVCRPGLFSIVSEQFRRLESPIKSLFIVELKIKQKVHNIGKNKSSERLVLTLKKKYQFTFSSLQKKLQKISENLMFEFVGVQF